ncbi:helix-turn-helix domain-containing protein [Streptomyces sp. NPDC058304]|uniref:helix-turn-helix domain-containing protein n=1 Tax=Streptomyces sp. NPDC058304 TaxID=3346437 RepID=UPI0036E86ECD
MRPGCSRDEPVLGRLLGVGPRRPPAPGGRTGGQKPKLGPRQIQLAREMYDSGDYTVQQIADEFGVTRPTIYRHLDKALPQQAADTP